MVNFNIYGLGEQLWRIAILLLVVTLYSEKTWALQSANTTVSGRLVVSRSYARLVDWDKMPVNTLRASVGSMSHQRGSKEVHSGNDP